MRPSADPAPTAERAALSSHRERTEMEQTATAPTTIDARRPSRTVLAALAVAVSTIVLVLVIARMAGSSHPDGLVPMPLNPEIEARWGIRVTQVAVSADGGLIDFRFLVLEPENASASCGNRERCG